MENEQNIPIDIHTNKLLDWLISRRHTIREWQKPIDIIREKINAALQDMPAHDEITKLLSGAYINYFHCLRIVEILRDTESETKNIFGRYSSQRMKDWTEIVKLYENDSIYLAEVAQMLIRNVNYDIPAIKKQIVKCQNSQEEYVKKKADCVKNANEMKAKFQTSCKELGIKGKNVKVELLDLLKELPKIYDTVVNSSKKLEEPIEFYTTFREFVLCRPVEAETVLPTLKYLIKNGNVTTYEWRTGNKPAIIDAPIQSKGSEPSTVTAQDDVIDFGDYVSVDSNGNMDVINITAEAEQDAGGDIDWGDSNEADIDWGISTEEPGSEQEEDSGVAKGNDSLLLLDNVDVRNKILNELMELETFLMQRLEEMKGEDDLVSFNQLQQAPTLLQLQTIKSVSAMMSLVTIVLDQLMKERTKHLLMIKEAPRYVDRLAESLQQKLTLADKMLASQESINSRRQKVIDEQAELEPKLNIFITKTKILQKQIEEDISKRYKGRPVNIIGGIGLL